MRTKKQQIKNKNKNTKKDRVKMNPSSGFATRMKVSLVYEDLITLAPGTAYGSYNFRGNSLFDPDYTGTGHQPRYFDQLSAIYGRYRVLGSKIDVELINGSGSAGVVYAVTPNTEIVTFTSWQLASELPRAKVSEIVPIASRYPFNVSSAATTTSICGLLPYEVNSEDWSAQTGANPLQIWYWNVNVISVDSSTALTVSFRVRLTYNAVMYDRLDVVTS